MSFKLSDKESNIVCAFGNCVLKAINIARRDSKVTVCFTTTKIDQAIFNKAGADDIFQRCRAVAGSSRVFISRGDDHPVRAHSNTACSRQVARPTQSQVGFTSRLSRVLERRAQGLC